MMITIGLVLSAIFLTGLLLFFKWSYKYWKRKNIPFDEPVIPFGSFADVILTQNEPFGSKVSKLYETAKRAGFREYGLFLLWRPVYVPIDPLIIKHILSIDFNIFDDRGMYNNKEADPLSVHLFSLGGQEWRNLRTKLTPQFTSGKIKMMIHVVIQCGEQLKKSIHHLTSLGEPVNIRELVGQFTTDVIGCCAFGIDCNFFENPHSEFIRYSKQVFKDTIQFRMKIFSSFVFPKLSKTIGLTIIEKKVSKFFLNVVKETVEYRSTHKVVRNDFMQLLLDLKNNEAQLFTFEDLAAQVFLFFIAGYETSTTTMTFCLFELSQNSEMQEKARKEIKNVLAKYNQEVTYEAVMEMKFLGQIIDETLRKYPSVPFLVRQNNADYTLPGSGNILHKGTSVFISCIGLHYDPEYFPDPEKFDPERFSDENKPKINPYTYLPFGEGPKNCIGLRFGIMQMKIGLIYLLKNYTFSLNEKTHMPLVMDPASTTLNALGGIWLNITKNVKIPTRQSN